MRYVLFKCRCWFWNKMGRRKADDKEKVLTLDTCTLSVIEPLFWNKGKLPEIAIKMKGSCDHCKDSR